MNEINPHMLVLFGVLGAISIAVFGIYVTRSVDRGGLKDGAGPKADAGGKTIVIAGKTYGLHTVPLALGSEHWVLSLPVGATQTFSVQREDGFEKLIDHLGVMEKVSSGNDHYDEEFEIRSLDALWTQNFFTNPENRRLVQVLFGLDSSTVILSGGRIQACFEEKASLAEGGPALSELADRLATRS
jgi:hypothetical protein